MRDVLFDWFYNKLKTVQSVSARVSPGLCKCLSLGGGAQVEKSRRQAEWRVWPAAVPSQTSLRFGCNTCEPPEVTGAGAAAAQGAV